MSDQRRKSVKSLLVLVKVFAVLGLLCLLPGLAGAQMPNNLSNAGCVSCHTDYPGIQPTNWRHSTTNCTRCHIGLHGAVFSVDKLWNCRYCHLTTYTDTYAWPQGPHDETVVHGTYTGPVSGFKSWRDPLRGAPLGSKQRWMASHFSGGTFTTTTQPSDWPIDANFTSDEKGEGFKHTSQFPGTGCETCHQNTLTAAHEGKTKVINNPTEDFEDGSFAFNFTGIWEGDWARVSQTVYSGAYSFKSGMIAVNLVSGPPSAATTETTVNVPAEAAVSFYYKVTNASYPLLFIVDGVQVFSGTSADWTKVSYPLAPGSHNLKWTTNGNSAYIDDLSVSGASTTYTVDCNTCHLSSDTSVNAAITNDNTDCSACHTLWDHGTPHTNSLDSRCQSCHLASLDQEHLINSVTQATYDPATGRTSLTCDTCHASQITTVQQGLKAKSLNCGGCHKQGHNIKFGAPVPADIPIYEGFKWSTSMEASLFAGQTAIPAGYENGRVILSNRRVDVDGNDIFNWYLNTEGTVLKSGVIGSCFTAEFERAGRLFTVMCYNTELSDGTGPVVPSGYRVEIWYK